MMLEATISALNIAQSNDQYFSVDKTRLAFLKGKVAEIEARIESNEARGLEHD
jgi:hypothetical protein